MRSLFHWGKAYFIGAEPISSGQSLFHWGLTLTMSLVTKMVNYLTNIVIMRSCAGKGSLKESYNRMDPLAAGLKHVCPAFNPPDIKFFLRGLRGFVVQSLPFLLSFLIWWGIIIHYSFNPMLHQRHITVQQIAKEPFFHLEIRQKLSYMNWLENLNRLVFNNHTAINEHIQPIASVNVNWPISYGQQYFTCY
jgi:hypothetical protein